MFRNYLAAALRNLARNKLYAAINLGGLAIGFAAAIFAGLYVRSEVTYEQWIPGHEQTYFLTTTYAFQQTAAPAEMIGAHRDAAAQLRLDLPQAEAVARLFPQPEMVVRRGEVSGAERGINAADDDFFAAVPLPLVAGDLSGAMARPDGLVLTRQMARKYFGRDDPVGEILEFDQHPMRVAAVIEDWPSNTAFRVQFFLSGRAAFASLSTWQEQRFTEQTQRWSMCCASTYVRLRPGTDVAAVQGALDAFARQRIPALMGEVRMRLLPLASLHLARLDNPDALRYRARQLAAIYGIGGVGALILLAAAVNFVNATTARATRRALEVGVRKATGAARAQLIVQFLGEALIFMVLAALAAIALVELLLPAFQGLLVRGQLDRAFTFAPWRDAQLALSIVAAVLGIGALAGLYPALLLSAPRPAAVLKGALLGPGGSGAVRQALVLLQFAILIGLAVATATVWRQTRFAMNDNLRFDKDQVLLLSQGCTPAMKNEIAALPGVRAAACSWGAAGGSYVSTIVTPSGSQITDRLVSVVDYGFFDVLGLRPLAGRFFSPAQGEDVASPDGATNPSVVINETAVSRLGFASADAAIGQVISWQRMPVSRRSPDTMPKLPSRIIGVVGDFSLSVDRPVDATAFYADMSMSSPGGTAEWGAQTLLVKLTGRDVPETLAAIDVLWGRLGKPGRPIQRRFLDQQLEDSYQDMIRQGQLFGIFAGVALFIASLGLFGLAAFTAERRTKEIGIRKAMGAGVAEILRLLLWQFARPVLWANLLAWPVAFFAMNRWLQAFAYHIDLQIWMFLAAGAAALAIALATVAGHTLLVARTRPVLALRYE